LDNLIVAIAAPFSAFLIGMIGLLIAQKMGLGPKQTDLIGIQQDLISTQKLKIDSYTSDLAALRTQIADLTTEVIKLKDTIVAQANEITRLNQCIEQSLTKTRKKLVTTVELKPEEDEHSV